MKVSAVAASLAVVLSAAPVFAQALGQPPKPQTPPATPAQPPAQPAVQTPPPPAAPFPAGAKIAFFRPQVVFQSSAEGKAALTRVQALTQKKQNENAAKNKALQDAQAKLQGQGGVLNDAARAQLEKDIEKQQVELQRFQQDAQAEIQELQQEVQNDFVKKLNPIIDRIANEKGIQLLFDADQPGLAWAAPGMDLTGEVIKALDTKPGTTAPKQ
ncbi:MAG TPA: OmpH family outer membrane protein [Vicinamibacterales bacterium]|nr:OmpH family outer membrane protein [Vicinamibacterales bacterium]